MSVLAEYGDEAKVLAGGQSLIPMLALRLARFEHLVDLARVPGLTGVERSDGTVRVAAMTPHATVESSPLIASDVPLLARAAPYVGHLAIRNRGTMGGALAHADPAAEFPAVAVALDAVLEVVGPDGARRVDAADFFVSTWTSALASDEILLAARFPVWTGSCGFAVEEYARRHGDYAMAGVVCGLEVDGGVVSRASIAFISLGSTPVRAVRAEAQLVGSPADSLDLAAISAVATDGLEPGDEAHSSGPQRVRMARALVQRALATCLEEARS